MSAADITELIPLTIILLTSFALVVSLATNNFSLYSDTAKRVQEETYRAIVVSENMLEAGEGEYLHRSGRSVIDRQMLEDAEVSDGRCYLDGVERLDGGNFSLRVSGYLTSDLDLAPEVPSACRTNLAPFSDNTPQAVYAPSTPVVVRTPSAPDGKTELSSAQVTVFALE